MIDKIKKFLFNPEIRFSYLLELGLTNWMSDESFLKKEYKFIFGKELNLENPQTFNEKMQWLKINNRKPEYTMMADKYLVREYIKEKIGEKYLIPFIGVWEDPDEIDFTVLPEQFVLKCNHNSGLGMCICKNKSDLDINLVRKNLRAGIRQKYFYRCREWPYKNIPPRIIAEKFMTDGQSGVLPVYKIFCFNGEPKMIQSIQNDTTCEETVDYFDVEWNHLDLRQTFPNAPQTQKRPKCLNEMLDVARTLSKNEPFIRIDLYEINGSVYFSEITFYSDAGFGRFNPEKWDRELGDLIYLPEK